MVYFFFSKLGDPVSSLKHINHLHSMFKRLLNPNHIWNSNISITYIKSVSANLIHIIFGILTYQPLTSNVLVPILSTSHFSSGHEGYSEMVLVISKMALVTDSIAGPGEKRIMLYIFSPCHMLPKNVLDLPTTIPTQEKPFLAIQHKSKSTHILKDGTANTEWSDCLSTYTPTEEISITYSSEFAFE